MLSLLLPSFLIMFIPPPLKPTLFPYTTLFRSIKPTVGLISRDGIVPITADQDTAGPLARTVRDAAILLRSEEHTSELQSRFDFVCRLLLEKKKHSYGVSDHGRR